MYSCRAPWKSPSWLSASRLGEQRVERERVERARVPRVAVGDSRPPVGERATAPLGRPLREPRRQQRERDRHGDGSRQRRPARPRLVPHAGPSEQRADREQERRAHRDEVPVEVDQRVQHVRGRQHGQRDHGRIPPPRHATRHADRRRGDGDQREAGSPTTPVSLRNCSGTLCGSVTTMLFSRSSRWVSSKVPAPVPRHGCASHACHASCHQSQRLDEFTFARCPGLPAAPGCRLGGELPEPSLRLRPRPRARPRRPRLRPRARRAPPADEQAPRRSVSGRRSSASEPR